MKLPRRKRHQVDIPSDLVGADLACWERVYPHTMTSPARIYAVRQAITWAARQDIPGAIVECGVWEGGSMMAAALTLLELGDVRDLYLYDTFEGMPEAGSRDRSYDGRLAGSTATGACAASLELVRHNMESTGYPPGSVHYVAGPVEETLAETVPDRIAVLRLDTDWYESTKVELEVLYPRLEPSGILIVDDYGYWQGARAAVDEYFGDSVFLHRIDDTGRLLMKPA